jgi:hypothetical protein
LDTIACSSRDYFAKRNTKKKSKKNLKTEEKSSKKETSSSRKKITKETASQRIKTSKSHNIQHKTAIRLVTKLIILLN